MTTAATPRPRFLHRRFSVRGLFCGLFRLVFVVVCLITLFALAMAFETWRSAREWRAWRAAAEARGERFDWASIIPPTPPPEQNFAAIPLFQKLFDYTTGPNGQLMFRDPAVEDWRKNTTSMLGTEEGGRPSPDTPNSWETGSATDLAGWADLYRGNPNYPPAPDGATPAQTILAALGKFDTEMEELRTASERPQSVFPLHYNEGASMRLVHHEVLGKLESITVLRSLALGRTGPSERAFDELLLAQRLAEALRTEPNLGSTLTRVGYHRVALQPVWEALADRRLNGEQLTRLQSTLASVNFVPQLAVAVRAERAFTWALLERIRTGAVGLNTMLGRPPPGPQYQLLRLHSFSGFFFYRSELVISRYFTEGILPVLDPLHGAINFGAFVETNARMKPQLNSLFNLPAGFLTATYDQLLRRILFVQAGQNMAVGACALERWRLTHDAYPETLDALVPGLLDQAPVDPFNGQPLHYRRTPAGRYLLYSVGGSGRDNGGQPEFISKRAASLTAGNWVWSYEKLKNVWDD